MKLDCECLRDLMLYIENNLFYGEELIINDITDLDYPTNKLIYISKLLIKEDYIEADEDNFIDDDLPTISIYSITIDGYSFLDKIRDNSVWNKIKEKISKSAPISIPLISSIGAEIISTLI